MTAPEFSRPFRLDTIGPAPRHVDLMADAGERAALAERFRLVSIARLEATAEIMRTDEVVTATGRLVAEVTQSCVATGAPLPARIAEPFAIRFLPAGSESDADEIELTAAECDSVFYEGGQVDLGEAVAESLALALDPFPRSPDAEQALRAAGVIAEEEAGPFGALKALRDRLANP